MFLIEILVEVFFNVLICGFIELVFSAFPTRWKESLGDTAARVIVVLLLVVVFVALIAVLILVLRNRP